MSPGWGGLLPGAGGVGGAIDGEKQSKGHASSAMMDGMPMHHQSYYNINNSQISLLQPSNSDCKSQKPRPAEKSIEETQSMVTSQKSQRRGAQNGGQGGRIQTGNGQVGTDTPYNDGPDNGPFDMASSKHARTNNSVFDANR